MRRWPLVLTAVVLTVLPNSTTACTLCGSVRQTPTFRMEAAQPSARLIMVGVITASKLKSDLSGGGVSDFTVEAVLKTDPNLVRKDRKAVGDKVQLPLYLPSVDPKKPPRVLVFCDVEDGKIDPYRPIEVKSADTARYVQGALALDAKDTSKALLYFFKYLDHADPEIATDAFLEWSRAGDHEVGAVAAKLPADKLRTWVKDKNTPPERLGLYAFLLGACGTKDDAALFEALLAKPDERAARAYDGILSGYIQLKPREGWELALKTLREGKQSLPVRLAVVRTFRFYFGWDARNHRAQVLKGMDAILTQGELADLAVADLRTWQIWDLTPKVLGLFDRKGLDAPIMRRGIVRYALTCPKEEAKKFVAELRKKDADLVQEVEEAIQLEKGS